jgi:AraC-like DNA-binding protein
MIVYTSSLIILLSILISIFNGRANKNAYLLSAYFIIFSIYPLTYHFTFFSTNDFLLAIIFYQFSPLYFVGGPLLYFYVKGTLRDKIEWKWIHLFHLLPFIVFFINVIPYLFSSFSHKLAFAHLIHQNAENLKILEYNWFIPKTAGLILRPISVGIYIIASFYQIYRAIKYYRQEGRQFQLIIRWLSLLLIISTAFMIVYGYAENIARQNDIKTTFSILKKINYVIGGLFFVFPISILIFPQILYGIPIRERIRSKKPLNDPLNTKKYIPESNKNHEAFKILSNRIIEYFDNEMPYLKQDFSLTVLAAALNCPQHHISYCFSDFLEISFTKLRASRRVEHAKTLLLKGVTKKYTMEKVAAMSGFSSRSTFFSTFKEYTGLTPSEFIEVSNEI